MAAYNKCKIEIFEKSSDLDLIWYMGGFQVADHESVFRFTKFNMADLINNLHLYKFCWRFEYLLAFGKANSDLVKLHKFSLGDLPFFWSDQPNNG